MQPVYQHPAPAFPAFLPLGPYTNELPRATFADWTKDRVVPFWGTNAGATVLPFQSWRHFKEAFAPELIARAIKESAIPVKTCMDPFGGSGTTALACQFLGVEPITVEVNPFLADLIEAKLATYDPDALATDLRNVVAAAHKQGGTITSSWQNVPPTFVEPGLNERWIFDRAVADRIAALCAAIALLVNETHRRLFTVLLGGTLIEVSNVIVNGKGRRYRRGWQNRRRNAFDVSTLFCDAVRKAITEVHQYKNRACLMAHVHRGDCRQVLANDLHYDLVVCSPPYPNSFDYTDVYNVELWALGYLGSKASNTKLREATLSSHVQISRTFQPAPTESLSLQETMKQLEQVRASLWSPHIPEMVGGYFAELNALLRAMRGSLTPGGKAWMVVGDSRYSNVHIATATILAELAHADGWELDTVEPFRSMRASPQQGGRAELTETLLVLTKPLTA